MTSHERIIQQRVLEHEHWNEGFGTRTLERWNIGGLLHIGGTVECYGKLWLSESLMD